MKTDLKLDIRVLTREYSSGLARAAAVRQYLEEARKNGIQADRTKTGIFEGD
jgi:hypothetical protein